MSLRQKLSNNRTLRGIQRRLWNFKRGAGWAGFHADPIYRQLMFELIKNLSPSSFVETGTYLGWSTELVARWFPNLPVISCEIVDTNYHIARDALKKYPNITQHLGSSDKILGTLIGASAPLLGECPIFYLDAHWQLYWPLRNELSHISGAHLKGVIVIDDFEVPGQPQFGYDIDGGASGANGGGQRCNFDYIKPALSQENQMQIFYPKYSARDAFGCTAGELRGHVVLFQNLPGKAEAFIHLPLIQQHYFQGATD